METETDLEAFQQLPPEAKGEQRKTPPSAMEKVGKTWRKWGVNRTKIEVSPVLRDIFLGDSSWDM